MIGQLYHCLRHRKLFDEHTAFPAELAAAACRVGIVRCLPSCTHGRKITRPGTPFDFGVMPAVDVSMPGMSRRESRADDAELVGAAAVPRSSTD